MKVILYGNVFAHSYLGMNSIFRVSGYPNTAMYITFVSVLINIILAPIFIFVLDWGVAGAAWATVSAQIICCLVQLYLFMRRDRVVYIEKDKFRLDKQIVARSFAIGSPNFAQNAAACFVVVLQNFALLKYGGDLYIGAFSIINRIIFLFIMVITSLLYMEYPEVPRQYTRLLSSLTTTSAFESSESAMVATAYSV